MSVSLRRSGLWILLWSLVAACGTARRAERPHLLERLPPTVQEPAAPPAHGLYAADEALRDALSGPWQYVGTGAWPGISRMQACAFRNARVLVVNVYCTITETPAFRIDVYSPTRGRVRIYAESRGAVSARKRRDYFTFTAESEPPPAPEVRLPPLALTMSFPELRAYDEKRYAAFLPTCYGGQELSRKRGGCLGALAPQANAWADRNRSFLDHASDDWYRIVHEMRALAARYGREPD